MYKSDNFVAAGFCKIVNDGLYFVRNESFLRFFSHWVLKAVDPQLFTYLVRLASLATEYCTITTFQNFVMMLYLTITTFYRHNILIKTRNEWWWIVFAVWLTDERRLALFPAGTIVRDPHHRESLTPTSRVWTCTEPEFRFSWMKLCGSDNHHTMVPQNISSKKA